MVDTRSGAFYNETLFSTMFNFHYSQTGDDIVLCLELLIPQSFVCSVTIRSV